MKNSKELKKRLTSPLFLAIWAIGFLLVLFLGSKAKDESLFEAMFSIPRKLKIVLFGYPVKNMAGFSCGFNSEEDLNYWKPLQTNLRLRQNQLRAGERSVEVTFYPATAPGFALYEDTIGVMDLTEVEAIFFEVYNPQGWPIDLKVKIKDVSGKKYQKNVKIEPQELKRVKLDVATIGQHLDISRVNYFNLFLWEPKTETILYFDNLLFLSSEVPKSPDAFINFMGSILPEKARPGQEIDFSAYFITHRQFDRDHKLVISLKPGEGGQRYLVSDFYPLEPTTDWAVGKLIQIGPVKLKLPEEIVPGLYEVEVMLAYPMATEEGLRYLYQPYEDRDIGDYQAAEIVIE